MKDDGGLEVGPGDWISFSYGVPPVGVRARISSLDGELVATTLGAHKPRKVLLKSLRQHVGSWYRADGPGYQT